MQIETKQSRIQLNPSSHREVVANYASATTDQVNASIDAALKAKPQWEATPFEDRDRARRLGDAECNRGGRGRDRRRGFVPGPEALGQWFLELGLGGEISARRQDDAIAADDE